MKPLRTFLSPAVAVAVLLGASVAVAGGYTALSTSNDRRDHETESEAGAESEMEAEGDGGYSADAPGQQFGHGDDWYGSGPRGLAVAEYAMSHHHGVPDGFGEHGSADSAERGASAAEHGGGDDDGADTDEDVDDSVDDSGN